MEVVEPLPKASFVKTEDGTCSEPARVADNSVRGFGCEHISLKFSGTFGISITKLLEPLEREPARRVEYDVDERGTFMQRC